ncbi:hypothetical protein D3C72_1993930 [compost metagenome]
MHDHPEGEVGKGPARRILRLADDNFREALLAHQHRLQMLEHQPEKSQGGLEPCTQGRLSHR